MKDWLTRQRRALLLLPAALLLAAVANSARLDDYWWSRDLHQAATPDAQGVVHLVDEYDDGHLRYPIEADLSVTSVEPITSLPGASQPATLPAGSMLWKVGLHVEADPGIALTGCSVALMEADGTRHVADSLEFDAHASIPIDTCTPDGAPGPQPEFGSTEPPAVRPGTSPRPPAYDTVTYVVTPQGAEPTEVRVWWLLPTYASFPIG